MSKTFQEATDQILEIFKAAWDTTGYDVFYQEVREQRSDSTSPWASVFIGGATSSQTSLSNSVSSRTFTRSSFITIQIFTSSGKGLQENNNLVKLLADAFEGVSKPFGVWVRSVDISSPINEGAFVQTNVTVNFTYDEIK